MRKLAAVLSTLILMAVMVVLPVRAQSVTDFNYCTDISVLNETGATIADSPVRAGINTLNYVNAGFLNATATDMELYNLAGSAIIDMTAQDVLINGSSDWIHVNSVADGGSVTDTLCSGSTIFTTRDNGLGLYGSTENVTVTDASTLDVTGDFTLEVEDVVFYNIASAESPLIRKEGAYELGVRSTNTVYARLVDAATTVTAAGTPTALGEGATAVNLIETGCDAGSQQDCVDTNDGDTSYVYSNTASGFLDSYYTLSSGLPTGAVISSVTGTARGRCVSGAASFDVKVGVRIGGAEAEQTISFITTGFVTTTTANIAAPGGGSWEDITPASLDGGEIKLSIDNNGSCPTGAESRVTWVYLTITYYNAVEATYSPVAVDTEYDLKAQFTGGQITLVIDGIQQTPVSTAFFVRSNTKDLVMGSGFTGYTQHQDVQTSAVGGMLGMLPAYEIVEECITSGTEASHTFTLTDYTIPQWAVHLIVQVIARTDRASTGDNAALRFNGDSGSNYNEQVLVGTGAATAAARSDSQTQLPNSIRVAAAGDAAGVFTGGALLIPEYANVARHKLTIGTNGDADDYVQVVTGRWASTAAIISVTVLPGTGPNFVANSCFTLAVVDERYSIHAETLALDGIFDVTGIPAFTGQLAAIGVFKSDQAGAQDDLRIVLNGDTTTWNYTRQRLYGQDAATAALSNGESVIGRQMGSTAPANEYAAFYGSISQFAEGTNNPSYVGVSGLHESGTPVGRVELTTGRRNNVAAINRVGFIPSGGTNEEAGSSLWLYMVPQVLIERVTVDASPDASITFSAIPQDRGTLTLNVYGRSDRASGSDPLTLEYNGDTTAANYSYQRLGGSSTAVFASTSAASPDIGLLAAASTGANIFTGLNIRIPNYTDTAMQQTAIMTGDFAGAQAELFSARWGNTAPVTSIKIAPSVGNFVQYTVAELWGFAPPTTPTYAVDFPYEADEIAQTQEGASGNGWTWLGTVADQSGNANDGAYTFIRDMTNITVTVGPAVAAAALTTITAAEVSPSLVSGDPDPGFANPYVEGTTPASFSWPLSIVANINNGVTGGYPLQLLAWTLALIVGLAMAFGVYRVTKIIAWTIIASVAATALIIYMTPVANVIILLMIGTAVVTIFLIPRSWETQ
jgi:hypothetical protein